VSQKVARRLPPLPPSQAIKEIFFSENHRASTSGWLFSQSRTRVTVARDGQDRIGALVEKEQIAAKHKVC
jgi:hypothetical protein